MLRSVVQLRVRVAEVLIRQPVAVVVEMVCKFRRWELGLQVHPPSPRKSTLLAGPIGAWLTRWTIPRQPARRNCHPPRCTVPRWAPWRCNSTTRFQPRTSPYRSRFLSHFPGCRDGSHRTWPGRAIAAPRCRHALCRKALHLPRDVIFHAGVSLTTNSVCALLSTVKSTSKRSAFPAASTLRPARLAKASEHQERNEHYVGTETDTPWHE